MTATLQQWLRELVHAARRLARAPGFAVVTIVTLGIAIAATVAVYSVVSAVLLDPLPFPDASRLVAIKSSTPGNNTPPEYGVSPEFYVQYKDAPALADVGLYSGFGATLDVDGTASRVTGARVTTDFFTTLGVPAAVGRLPQESDFTRDLSPDSIGSSADADVVLISNNLWRSQFGGDPGAVGSTLRLDGRARTIIGVMAPRFDMPTSETDFWAPFQVDPATVSTGQFSWSMIGRLAEGTDLETLQGQLATLAARLPELYPSPMYAAFLTDGQYRPIVRRLKEDLVGDLAEPLWILFGTVAVVLLIACANAANLFLVRAESRQHDMAVRAALGAGRGRLLRAHLSEALVLAVAGGVCGLLLASAGVPALLKAAPPGTPRLDAVKVDAGVLGFTALVSVASALLFGTMAAVRYSSPGLLTRLRQAARGPVARERQLTRNSLVVVQSALALVLLVGSGLLVRSFAELMGTDPGFDADGVLSFQITLPPGSYDSAEAMARFHTSLLQRMAALPGVRSAGLARELPLSGHARGTAFEFDQSSQPTGALPPITYYTHASPGYFETMGIGLISGRTFVRADDETDRGHAIVSRTIAERYWPGEDPIGKRLRLARDSTGWETVVGVVEDVRDVDLREPSRGLVYLPLVGREAEHGWSVPSATYALKADDPGSLADAVREEVRRADAGLPVYSIETMADVVSRSVVRLSFTMLALGIAAFMAVVLGAIGLYGVLSYVVTGRTREIGVRLALGARAEDVRRMVVTQGVGLAILGMLIGVLAAAALTRVLQGLLYGTQPLDPVTFAVMSTVMILAALLASYVPARRASSVDPLESMRAD